MKRTSVVAVVASLACLGLPAARANHPPNTCVLIDGSGATTVHTAGQTASVEAGLAVGNVLSCGGGSASPTNGAVKIEFVVAGANDGVSLECSIQQDADICVASYVGKQAGTDVITGWIDDNADGVRQTFEPADTVVFTWNEVPNTLDCDDSSGGPGDDSVEEDTERETNVGSHATSSQNVHCYVNGPSAGEPAPAGTLVFGEVITAVNDPDSTDGASYSTQDYTCEIGSAGSCTFQISQIESELGTTTVCFWVGTPSDGANLCGNEAVGENQSTSTLIDSGNDFADAVQLRWVPYSPNVRLDCRPETAVNDPGTDHTITCSATSTPSLVHIEIVGDDDPDDSDSPESPDLSCETFSLAGACTVTHDIDSRFSVGTATYVAWIDTDRSRSTFELDTGEGRDETVQPGATAESDKTDVVSQDWRDVANVNCGVETNVSLPDVDAEVTCITTDPADGSRHPFALVRYEITGFDDDDGNTPEDPDGDCITDEDGACTIRSNIAPGVGTQTWRWWVDSDRDNDTIEADLAEGLNEVQVPGTQAEPDGTDVITRTWAEEMDPQLDCTEETTVSEPGDMLFVTCHAMDGDGESVSAIQVDHELTGFSDPDGGNTPETPDVSCTTATSGRCTIEFRPPVGTGTTLFRSWIDDDGDNVTVEADATEGTLEAQTPGLIAEPDTTDVVQGTWMSGAPPQTDTCPGFENDSRNQIVGTPGAETLTGTSGNDIICGFGGIDTLLGGGGDDVLLGAGGADTLRAGGGNDVLRGGGGPDMLFGGRGVDTCRGGPGVDTERGC